MTLRKWAVDYCFQRGMFEDQAKAVVDLVVANESSAAMKGRWEDPVDAYPPALLAVLTMAINHHAVAWIESNCPQAWYKPLFDGTADKL